MAKGKSTGRNHLPRISSREGREKRQEIRVATMPKDPKGGRAYRKPGSGNRKKISR
jgi:hypothetical protein